MPGRVSPNVPSTHEVILLAQRVHIYYFGFFGEGWGFISLFGCWGCGGFVLLRLAEWAGSCFNFQIHFEQQVRDGSLSPRKQWSFCPQKTVLFQAADGLQPG